MALVAFPRFLGPVPLDVVVTEDHLSELEITQNPIEIGADVADHAYVKPKRFRMEAVTASRIQTPALVHAAYQAVVRLQETRQPFEIVTGLTLYRSMLIERIQIRRSAENSRILHFEAELTEVIIVNTQSVPGSLSKSTVSKDVQDKASPTVDRGSVKPPEVEGPSRNLYDALKTEKFGPR